MAESPLLGEFLKHLSLERGLSRNTCLAYASDLGDFLRWLEGKDPLKADSRLLDGYLWHLKSDKELMAVSIFRKMEAMKCFYRYLVLEGNKWNAEQTKSSEPAPADGALPPPGAVVPT